MKDKELKLEDVKAPHTHWVEHHTTISVHRSRRRSLSLFEVELLKPRNLSAHESEEYEHGEGVGVHATLLQSDTRFKVQVPRKKILAELGRIFAVVK